MNDPKLPGMRRLLVVEHVVRAAPFASLPARARTNRPAQEFPLGLLKAGDGRVSFNATCFVENKCWRLSLSSCMTTVPVMIRIKMSEVNYVRTEAHAAAAQYLSQDKTKQNDHHLKPGDAYRNGNSIQVLSLSNICDSMTILFTVFDCGSHPSYGAALSLNQARLQGKLCDVKLVVDGVRLPAHRTVLAVRSPVLEKMLMGDFKEAREGRVKLVDFSRVAVEKFVEFLYTDRIENWGDSHLELLQLADKYMVPELRAECLVELWFCDAPRALDLLHSAIDGCKIISSELRQRLMTIVMDNVKSLADTEQWAAFTVAHPDLGEVLLLSAAQTTSVRVAVVPGLEDCSLNL